MNVDFMECFGRGRPKAEVCEGCEHKQLCTFVEERFVPKEEVKRALSKISEIERILKGDECCLFADPSR